MPFIEIIIIYKRWSNARIVEYVGLERDWSTTFLHAKVRFKDFLPIIIMGDTCSNAKAASNQWELRESKRTAEFALHYKRLKKKSKFWVIPSLPFSTLK
jgi:hypothetical protein